MDTSLIFLCGGSMVMETQVRPTALLDITIQNKSHLITRAIRCQFHKSGSVDQTKPIRFPLRVLNFTLTATSEFNTLSVVFVGCLL